MYLLYVDIYMYIYIGMSVSTTLARRKRGGVWGMLNCRHGRWAARTASSHCTARRLRATTSLPTCTSGWCVYVCVYMCVCVCVCVCICVYLYLYLHLYPVPVHLLSTNKTICFRKQQKPD